MSIYEVSGSFGDVRIIRNPFFQTIPSILDTFLSTGWHRCNSLYHITKPEGNQGYLILLTMAGEGRLCIGSHQYSLSPNTAAIVPAGTPCEYNTPEGKLWEFYWVHGQGSHLMLVLDHITQFGGSVFCFRNREQLAARMESLLETSVNGQKSLLESTRILDQLLLDLVENTMEAPENATPEAAIGKTLVKYIQTWYAKPISLQELSDLVFLSPNHMIRVFKKETGVTPYQYLKNTRLTRACDLLLFTGHPLKQIAAEVGYQSESNFIQHFRRWKQITPQAYRKQRSVALLPDE